MRVLIIALCLSCCFGSAQAQLFSATSEYRVVEVDQKGGRLGVAQMDADPNVRQNWVYLKFKTEVSRREELEEGVFRMSTLTVMEALQQIQKGDVVKVHGGRDWDGSINAKSLQVASAAPRPAGPAATKPAVAGDGSAVNPSPPEGLSEIDYGAGNWSGVVKDVSDSSVILERADGTALVLPRSLDYPQDPVPGAQMDVPLPAGHGKLVSATSEIVTLESPQGLIQVPTAAIDGSTMVPVVTSKGTSLNLPLSSALELREAEGAGILASQYSARTVSSGAGVVLESGPDFTLLATPSGQIVSVPKVAGALPPTPGLGVNLQSDGAGVKLKPWAPGRLKLRPGSGKKSSGKKRGGKKGKGKFKF